MVIGLVVATVTVLWFFRPQNKIEGFAQVLNPETGEFESAEQLDYNLKKDLLLDTRTQDYWYCKELCKTSDKCNAFNYALNRCSLYKNAEKVPSISWLYN